MGPAPEGVLGLPPTASAEVPRAIRAAGGEGVEVGVIIFNFIIQSKYFDWSNSGKCIFIRYVHKRIRFSSKYPYKVVEKRLCIKIQYVSETTLDKALMKFQFLVIFMFEKPMF